MKEKTKISLSQPQQKHESISILVDKLMQFLILSLILVSLDAIIVYSLQSSLDNIANNLFLILSAFIYLFTWRELRRNLNKEKITILVYLNSMGMLCSTAACFFTFYKVLSRGQEFFKQFYFEDEVYFFYSLHIIGLILYSFLNSVFPLYVTVSLARLGNSFNQISYIKAEDQSTISRQNVEVLDLSINK
jgi:hypothetical protein